MKTLLNYGRQATHISLAGWVISLIMMSRLPDAIAIRPPLFEQPIQAPSQASAFHFYYKDQDIKVIPKLEYEISGLIVSHNDPQKWYRFDITHDDLSLNTRDICLAWGRNLKQNDYKRISFYNSDYMCEWDYDDDDVDFFNAEEVSNNRLITANDDIRKQINALNVGDQITLKGKLVSYREERWPGAQMLHSSNRRNDTGPSASEIILVEKLTVHASQNQFWAYMREFCFWFAIFLMTLRVTFMLAPRSQNGRVKKTKKPRRWSNED